MAIETHFCRVILKSAAALVRQAENHQHRKLDELDDQKLQI